MKFIFIYKINNVYTQYKSTNNISFIKMCTEIMFRLRVRKRLCVSVFGGKRSIYFLLNIRYLFIYIYINI